MTQCDRVLQYMRDYGSITAWEAMRDLGVMRLGARVYDLRRDGHRIGATTEKGKNRYGEACWWTRYTIKGVQ